MVFMHFLLMVLRLVLDRLFSLGGDHVSLAARADGRLEHVPTRLSRWNDWLRFLQDLPCRLARGAQEVRAAGSQPLARQSTSSRCRELRS